MKKQFLKLTMLLFALVWGGNEAWAQNEIFNRADASAWVADDATEWGNSATVDTKGLQVYSKTQNDGFLSAKRTFDFASNTKVTLEAVVKLGNDSGNETSYDYFTFGGLTLKVYRMKDTTKDHYALVVDGEEQVLPGSSVNSTEYKINFVVDQSTGIASYALGLANNTLIATGSVKTTTSLSDVEFGHYFDNKKKTVTIYVKSLKITEENAPSNVTLALNTAADYTYSTLSPEWDLDFTTITDVEAYKAIVSGNVVKTEKVNKVRAYEGVLIKNVNHVASVTVPLATDAEALKNNALVGVTSDMTASYFSDKSAYILASDTEFQLITSESTNSLAKGKAFLLLPEDAGAKPMRMIIDETTAIKGIADVESNANNVIYNLQGMRISAPSKGLYIKNGKKYRF